MKIAFLGTGLMGSGFVRRLLAEGHTVHVWNRSPGSAQALVAHGAKAFAASADAVAGVERVHLSLADDASVDAVLEPLADVIPASCWILDHTTTTPSATGERARRWVGRGRVGYSADGGGGGRARLPAGRHADSGGPIRCGNRSRRVSDGFVRRIPARAGPNDA